MGTIVSIKPLLAILISTAAIPFIIISGKRPNIRESWTFIAAITKFLIVLSIVPVILAGETIEFTIAQVLPEISIRLKVDSMGILFALVSSFLWILTSAYSVGYMRSLKEHNQTRYFAFFAISLSATIGVAFSANLLTMYLFYEILSFATYPLVTHHQDDEAKKSGRKYLTYIVGASIGLALPGMLIVFAKTGTLEFTNQGVFGSSESSGTILFLLILLVLGFAKSGIMPFHSWLPAAMVAPTPVSALLHAVAVVKVGVFCILRVITGIFGTNLLSTLNLGIVICYLAAFTIIIASLIALSQDSLKARLAFSTISQLSYIILGAALLSSAGLIGSLMHIVMHAFGKITLFFCAGAIFVTTGQKYISQMKGIGKQMPLTMAAFFIGSLSVIGIPPCGGFLSKWFLVLGTLEGDQLVMLFVLLTSSVLNAAYFFPIVYNAFFCAPEESKFKKQTHDAPIWCLIPLLLTAACSIILLFWPDPFITLAEQAAANIFVK